MKQNGVCITMGMYADIKFFILDDKQDKKICYKTDEKSMNDNYNILLDVIIKWSQYHTE